MPSLTVEVASSALAGLKGAAGYHTSIVLAGEEYVFTPLGILRYDTIMSHRKNPEMQVQYIGLTRFNGADLLECMDPYFPPDHYDLLRKNCNSFSDCALYFLCEQRLDPAFRTMEQIGKFADDHVGFLQSLSGGEYNPNIHSLAFDVEKVIREIDAERETCDGGSAGTDLDFPDSEIEVRRGETMEADHFEDPLVEINVDRIESARSSIWGRMIPSEESFALVDETAAGPPMPPENRNARMATEVSS
jgi:hypothetical protein